MKKISERGFRILRISERDREILRITAKVVQREAATFHEKLGLGN